MDNTEEKIRQAAKKLFAQKGLRGTTIRDLASEADVNVASLNYYFRSKEKLFLSIFEEMITTFIELGFSALLNRNIPIKDRISQYIDNTTSMLLDNQDMPIFVLSESHRDSELIENAAMIKNNKLQGIMEELDLMLKDEHEKGTIISITALQLDHLLVSQIIFPFLSKSMLCKFHNYEEKDFEQFVLERNKIIKEMVLKYLLSEQ